MLKDADNGIQGGVGEAREIAGAAHLKADSMTDDQYWELGNWEI